jgi:hypothetical protein
MSVDLREAVERLSRKDVKDALRALRQEEPPANIPTETLKQILMQTMKFLGRSEKLPPPRSWRGWATLPVVTGLASVAWNSHVTRDPDNLPKIFIRGKDETIHYRPGVSALLGGLAGLGWLIMKTQWDSASHKDAAYERDVEGLNVLENLLGGQIGYEHLKRLFPTLHSQGPDWVHLLREYQKLLLPLDSKHINFHTTTE